MCGSYAEGDMTVEVEIYSGNKEDWVLEIISDDKTIIIDNMVSRGWLHLSGSASIETDISPALKQASTDILHSRLGNATCGMI